MRVFCDGPRIMSADPLTVTLLKARRVLAALTLIYTPLLPLEGGGGHTAEPLRCALPFIGTHFLPHSNVTNVFYVKNEPITGRPLG